MPTTDTRFEIISQGDQSIPPECFDEYDLVTCRKQMPDDHPPSPWRQYLDDGDRKHLALTSAPIVFTCRPLRRTEALWTEGLRMSGGKASEWMGIVACGLCSVSGPGVDITEKDVARLRTRYGAFVAIDLGADLFDDESVFPSDVDLFSVADQIERRRLTARAATFRAAGGKA